MIPTYTITRHAVPHLRCGICDEQIGRGEATRYVDDERCHSECAAAGEPRELEASR